ncbi:MAG: zinc-dependent metalloprotease, partial [Actinomycetota bacterium]
RLSEGVRACEVLLAGYTRLPLDEPMRSEVVGRAWWVESTLRSWRWLLDRLADRFTSEMGRAATEDEANPMEQALRQVAPLLLGLQAGSLVGQLATEAVGRYDFPIPRDDEGNLFLLWRNASDVAREYGLEDAAFVEWLALRDGSRHLLVKAVPWLSRYHRSLLVALIEAIEIDVSDLERRLGELQSRGMDALQEGLSPDQIVPVVPTERHRRALDHLHAMVALFEGYAEHSSEAVASKVVGDAARIDEGMARRRASGSSSETMLSGILGISIDRKLETSGTTFCAAVVDLKGVAALNRVWDAPDNLPTLDEIKDPFAWIERVL